MTPVYRIVRFVVFPYRPLTVFAVISMFVCPPSVRLTRVVPALMIEVAPGRRLVLSMCMKA